MKKEEKTLLHHLIKLENLPSSMIAVKSKKMGEWKEMTWKEYFLEVRNIAHALLSLGVKKGDRVVLMSQTRPEWSRLDYGIMGVGAITVPIYPNNISSEMKYIIQESEAKIIVLENQQQMERWLEIEEECPAVTNLICIQEEKGVGEKEGSQRPVLSWVSFLEKGSEYMESHGDQFSLLCQNSRPEDVATFIYTSGTTGQPKGVVLTHRQLYSEVHESFAFLSVSSEDVFLSFLPFSHVFGRLESWGHIYRNPTLAFAESIETIASNLEEVKPTVLLAVPRIFEKIYASLLTKVESSSFKKKLFYWALGVGKSLSALKQKNQSPSFFLAFKYFLAKKLVFSKLHKKLGNRMKVAISGGAPLSSSIIEFFHAAGLFVLEGYGLTETTGAVCCNRLMDYEIGTVGKPIGDVKIKIAGDGEILIKSDKVMMGYYKKPEATKEVFDEDGYFKSGDIGEWTQSGFLKITDRKKDLIKTSGGKYVAPQKIENQLKLSRFISEVLVHGDGRKYIVALVVLEELSLKESLKNQSLDFKSLEEASKDPFVYQLVQKEVDAVNAKLSRYEQIKKFSILPTAFSIQSGELTPSLKVKRKTCDQKYKRFLDQLYK